MPNSPSDKPLHETVLETFLDPVLAGYVRDFDGGVQALSKTMNPDEHREMTTLLCELSRDVIFRLGPAEEVQDPRGKETIARIAASFRAAVDTIEPAGDPLIQAFRDHILERGEMLLGKKRAYIGSEGASS